MGGGNERDRRDRSGEYQDREPSDGTATTAQARLEAFTEDDLGGGENEQSSEGGVEADAVTGAEEMDASESGAGIETGEEFEDGDGEVGPTVGGGGSGDGGEESESVGAEDMVSVPGVDAAAAVGAVSGGDDESEESDEEEDDGDSDVASGDTTPTNDPDDDATDEASTDFDRFDDPNEAARHLGPTDERGFDVDLGPTDPKYIEEEFNVDLTDTDTVDNVRGDRDGDHEYTTLDFKQLRRVQRDLKERHGEETYNDLNDLMGSWKGGSDKDDKQTLELIAKKANGIESPVRRGGEGAEDVDADDPRIDAYRDMTRISRGFLKANQSEGEDGDGSMTVHRGVRMANEAFTAQFIDNPTADAYRLKTCSTSNHSTASGVAKEWGAPYTIQHEIDLDDVTLAIDHIRTSGMDEGELHIDSDDITIEADDLGFADVTGLHGDAETPREVFDAFDDPESASDRIHRDVRSLLKSMRERDEAPRTDDGARNLIGYFDGVVAHEDVSKQRSEETRKLVADTLDAMGSDRNLRDESRTLSALTDPASSTPEDHENLTRYISTYAYSGIREGHTDEDAEQLVGWVNYLADEQPMDDKGLRDAHRSVRKVLEEADTDVELGYDAFEMMRSD